MKRKIYLNVLLAIVSMISFSCDEEFSPQGELNDKIILSCILRGDTTVQTAFLSSSYAIEGFDPYSNKIDPAISNAEIRVWEADSVFLFKNSSFQRPDTARYNSLGSYYYSSFKPVANKAVEIEALLANGKRLRGFTKVPQLIDQDYALTDTVIPPTNKSSVLAAWVGKEPFLYYLPLFKIIYLKKINGREVRFEKPIPVAYTKKGDRDVPVYPAATMRYICAYDVESISRAMREISEGDPNKENYMILAVIVDIYVLDRNLSAYYSAGKLRSDGYTVSIDQADFTNIEGGLGIFGSYIKKSFSIFFDKKYIESFGYISVLR